MLERTRAVEQELGEIVNDLAPHALSGTDAVELVGVFAKIEKLASAGRVLAAQRVEDTAAHRRQGFRSAADLMAKQTGKSLGAAIGEMETAKKVGRLPRTEKAMREGRLSPQQASEVASGASADPSAEGDLLNSADRDGLKGLKDKTRAVKAAARSERDQRAKAEAIRRNRSFRHWNDDDGAFNYAGKTTNDIGARMLAVMKYYANQAFQETRRQGRREPLEAYAADAMAAMVEAADADADADDRAMPEAPAGEPTGPEESNSAPRTSAGGESSCEESSERSKRAVAFSPDQPHRWSRSGSTDATDPAELVRRAAARAAAARARDDGRRATEPTHPEPQTEPTRPQPDQIRPAPARAPQDLASEAPPSPSERQRQPDQPGAAPLVSPPDSPGPGRPPAESELHEPTASGPRPAEPEAASATTGPTEPAREPSGPPEDPNGQGRSGPAQEPTDHEPSHRWSRTGCPSEATDPPNRASRRRRRSGRAGPRAAIHFRIDYAAFLRGYTEPGEVCEIPGVGPVTVDTVRAYSHDAVLKALLVDGVHVRSVVHLSHTVTAHQRTALEERDPECVIDGCHVREHLEIDHVDDWAVSHITTLDRLARLCRFHHALKSYWHYRLEGGPGHWRLVPPDHD